ncbi:hypothetical protein AMST5_00718 [freshwater sediment metagenome]|uniref:Uncharacterized protein n=1 Tax=freshwater sediment metagenome TaxID=556182 RepID=A0AA48M0U0_9ZZZZ
MTGKTSRPSLLRLIPLLLRIKLARLLLLLARVLDYDAFVMRQARRLVDAAEHGMGMRR